MDSAEIRVDVRPLPRPERHSRIFAAFDGLASGQTLVLTSDHEPRPLHAQFEQRYGAHYTWEQRQLSDGSWQVRIAKPAPEESSPVIAVLRRSALFARLDEAALASLARDARRTAIKRHHAVVDQGVRWPYFGVVESGIVQSVLLSPLGREQAVYDVLAGETFGELAMLDSGDMPLRHVALTADTRVVLLRADAVREIANADRNFARALEERSAQHVRAILDRFAAHLSQSTTARIARALLAYAVPEMGLCPALAPLPNMTQIELAAAAGTVKEVVNRALAELEASGAILRDGGHIVKLDRDKLMSEISRG